MPQSDTQTALLIIQDLALLVTIIGWIYTGAQQRTILRETRRYERLDRDLSVYRTRMDKASELTRSLIETADKWAKLASFAKAMLDEGKAREFQALSFQLKLFQDAVETKRSPTIILYDPQFRTLRDLLAPEIAKKLYNSLKDSSSQIQVFVDKTYYMQPTDTDIDDQVRFIYEQGIKIADGLVLVADYFADAFAALDRKLTRDT